MDDAEPLYLDAEQQQNAYGSKETLNFRAIALQQLSRLMVKGTSEWYGGHWEETPIILNGVTFTAKKYIPDIRDLWINGVNLLADAIYPHLDAAGIKVFNSFEKDAEQLKAELQEKVGAGQIDIVKAKDIIAENHRKLFRILNIQMKKLRYFEGQAYEGQA